MHCALFEAIVRAQVNRKGVYMTSFKRGYNYVIFAFMLPPESAFCSNHDRKRTFLGCVHAYFAKAESAFWNADSKRRSKTPFTGVLFMLPSRRRLRSCLFCEGRISVLKRWFKTPIQNALHGSTVHASLEKKTISWACTAHCSRLLFELKWTGKAFIWRHLNVVICDFAFMLPPESAFCSNHDRKRTFLGCVHAYFAKAESAFWNADSKRRSKTPFTGVLFMLPSRRRRFREHALRIVRGYCSSSSEPERRLYDVI